MGAVGQRAAWRRVWDEVTAEWGFCLDKSLWKKLPCRRAVFLGLCGEAAVPSSAVGVLSATSPVPCVTKRQANLESHNVKSPLSFPPTLFGHPKTMSLNPADPTGVQENPNTSHPTKSSSYSKQQGSLALTLPSWPVPAPGTAIKKASLCPPGWEDTPIDYRPTSLSLLELGDSQKNKTSSEKGESLSFYNQKATLNSNNNNNSGNVKAFCQFPGVSFVQWCRSYDLEDHYNLEKALEDLCFSVCLIKIMGFVTWFGAHSDCALLPEPRLGLYKNLWAGDLHGRWGRLSPDLSSPVLWRWQWSHLHWSTVALTLIWEWCWRGHRWPQQFTLSAQGHCQLG